MNYIIGTQYKPCTLCITVSSLNGPCVVRVQVQDYYKRNSFLINRIVTFLSGQTETLKLPLPLAPKIALISVTDEGVGSDKEAGFKVVSITKTRLITIMKAIDRLGPDLLSFVDFGQRFAYNAGTLPTNVYGSAYCSRDNVYKIKYLDILTDENGKEQLTPARINVNTKIIQAAKRLMIPLSVPGRFCILTHEYSHLFENLKPEDEAEADLNGCTIYLGLGFPKYEAIETYRNILYRVNTEENRKRLTYIEDYISNFETIVNNIKK